MLTQLILGLSINSKLGKIWSGSGIICNVFCLRNFLGRLMTVTYAPISHELELEKGYADPVIDLLERMNISHFMYVRKMMWPNWENQETTGVDKLEFSLNLFQKGLTRYFFYIYLYLLFIYILQLIKISKRIVMLCLIKVF